MEKNLPVLLEDAEAALQAFLAEREALGLSNDGIVTNPAMVMKPDHYITRRRGLVYPAPTN